MHRDEASERETGSGLPWLGWVTLGLTAAMSMVWSCRKLLEQDEIFSLQTDRVGSLGEVLRIQRSYPISLEAPPYHVLAHAAMKVFGAGAFALRLPALCGFLLMQMCLYFFVRELVSPRAGKLVAERAGLVAMVLPALTWTMFYSAEGRPYGLLLGSYALAALCWQRSARDATGRVWPLVGLAMAIALTVNVHFYGVLLLVPLGGAELVRIVERRRLGLAVDWPMLVAMGVGAASVVLSLPYVRASGEFRKHYYAGPVSWHMLTQPYRQMLVNYTDLSQGLQTVMAVLLVVMAILVSWGCIRVVWGTDGKVSRVRAGVPNVRGVGEPGETHRPGSHNDQKDAAELVLVGLLVLLPVFAFVLGRWGTRALEVRHSIGAVIGIVVVAAVAITPWLRSGRVFTWTMLLLLLGVALVNGERARASAAGGRVFLEGLRLTPEQRAAVEGSADPNIYFQDLGEWEEASFYEPDAWVRSHMVLVYSRAEEMAHEQHDTMYLTAVHTKRFDAAPMVAYGVVRSEPGEHWFVVYRSGWDWTREAFASDATSVQPVDGVFGGALVRVRFKR